MPYKERIDIHFDTYRLVWVVRRDKGPEVGPGLPIYWQCDTLTKANEFIDQLLEQRSGTVFMSDDPDTQARLSMDETKTQLEGKGYLHSGQEPTQNQEQEPKEDHKKEPHQEQETSSHAGSTLESFLKEEGILEEVNAQVQLYMIKSTLSYMLKRTMLLDHVSKTQMAARMKTSRSQLDRVLDPNNTGVTLETLVVAAEAVGMRLTLEARTKKGRRNNKCNEDIGLLSDI